MFDSETFMKFIHLTTLPLLTHRNDLNLSLKEFIGHINSIAANDKPDLTLEDFFNLVASMMIENKLHLMLKDLIKVLSPVGLVKIMQAIPKNVTTLDLSSNDLGKSPVDKLVKIMKAIPKNVTTLDLSSNDLGKSPIDKLVKIMQAIPKNVTKLNLSHNWFCNKTCDELVKIMQAIPEHVTTIDLKYNFLFVNKIPNAIDDDKILNALNHFDGKSSSKQSTPWKRNLIFPYYDNEETDFIRALLPMLSATKSLLKRKDTFFPFEITCEILSYLLPKLGLVPTEVVGDRICGFFSETKLEEMATEAENNPEGKEADTLKRLCLTQYSGFELSPKKWTVR